MAKGSDLKRAFSEDGSNRTHIGGQALIEGVMMRGKLNWAVAVREPDGKMHSEEHPLSKKGTRPKWFSWPLVRGCVALVDSLVLGFKALEIAANHAFADEEEEAQEAAEEVLAGGLCIDGEFDGRACTAEQAEGETPSSAQASLAQVELNAPSADGSREQAETPKAQEAVPEKQEKGSGEDEPFFGKGEMTLSLVLGLVLGIGLFILLPAFASNLLVGEYEQSPLAWNIVDGVMRVAIFVFYVWLIGRMSDIKRMFSYHGAEHKTIHCYEHGLELTPGNARQFPRLHVRCGTAFLIMVMIIAILVYTIIPLNLLIASWGISGPAAFALLIAVRILFMPLIAGISYEITVKWAGSRPDNPLVRVVLWPGMQMQRLTTNEPDDSMLECAIEAMHLVVQREEAEAAKQA